MPRRMFAVVIAGLLGCTSPAVDDRPWQGELASYVVNRGDRSELEHRLRLADGTVRPLLFPAPPSLVPGSRLRVWGPLDGDAIRVAHHEVTEVAALSSALIDGPKKATRKWAFVLVDVDGMGFKDAIDKTNAESVLFSADRLDSIRSYFREVSYGVQDLEGQVFGPIQYQMGGRCDTDRLAQALTPMIPGQFNQYLWFFGRQQAACNWAGVADLGRADRPTRNSWYNSFHNCTVLVQEPGHNFGMVHSSAMRCTLGGAPVPIAWPEQETADCRHIEYGNPFDPMGGGDCFHMNGVQKAYQDWLGGCNVVRATESGTFTIHPLESACDGPQLLLIPFPQSRSFSNAGRLAGYYLELRTPVGRDRRLAKPHVLVTVANEIREARFTGNNNWLLDMTPETTTLGDEALPVGKTYEDVLPGGPKFTVLSADNDKAVIQVELRGQPAPADKVGKGQCSDMTEYQPPAQVRCVTPATPAAPPPRDGGTTPTSDGGAGPEPSPPPMGQPNGDRPDAGAPRKDARQAEPPEEEEPEPAPTKSAPSGGCTLGPGGPTGALAPLLVLLLAARRRRS